MIRADHAELHHRFAAKRSGQSAAHYAAALEIHRRPANWRAGFLLAAAILAAALLGAPIVRWMQ